MKVTFSECTYDRAYDNTYYNLCILKVSNLRFSND